MAGAISRDILKRTKCEKCLELLSVENLGVGTTNFEARQEFISKLSRGGLRKPSDVVYITCIQAFVFYPSIEDNTDDFEFLVNSTVPRSVLRGPWLIYLIKVTPPFKF